MATIKETIKLNVSIGNTQRTVNSYDFADMFAHECHAACCALLNNPQFFTTLGLSNPKICRGFHDEIGSQHSWIVAWKQSDSVNDNDIYDYDNQDIVIIDPTLWSYQNQSTFDLERYQEVLEHDGYEFPFDISLGDFRTYRHLLTAAIQIFDTTEIEEICKYHPHGNRNLDWYSYQQEKDFLFQQYAVLDNNLIAPVPLGSLRYLLDSDYLYKFSSLSNDSVGVGVAVANPVDNMLPYSSLDLIIEYFKSLAHPQVNNVVVLRREIAKCIDNHCPALLPIDYKMMFM